MDKTKPSYYESNGKDLINHYESMFDENMFNGFMIGNIIKYITRYKEKNGLNDLDKAEEYLHRLHQHELKVDAVHNGGSVKNKKDWKC